MKNILLIGASGGIGNKVAELLLEEKLNIIGTYFQHPERIKNLKKLGNFVDRFVDIRDIESIKNLHGFVEKKFTELFAVVNCSGIVDFEGKDQEKDFEIWNKIIATNLSGNYYLAKIFYDLLSKEGRFIMTSSTDAYFGGAITASYAASKAGVNSLTKPLSLLFQDKKISVNSIAPGWVMTPMAKINGSEFLDKVASINPLKRNAFPKDIAGLVKFLLSENASYINGQVISIEGGYTNQDPTLLLEQDIQG
ncbi:MAG: SDR family oxidoreductase [bacterium]